MHNDLIYELKKENFENKMWLRIWNITLQCIFTDTCVRRNNMQM